MNNQENRKLINLRYRLRKQGYFINDKNKVVILPHPSAKRSKKREEKIKMFGFTLQIYML